MNKTDFLTEVQKNFPQYKELTSEDALVLVKEYLPKEYRDHSKNMIKEVGNAFIYIKEEAGKVICNILTQGYVRYFHKKNWDTVNLFPLYYTANSYDELLSSLNRSKEAGEL